MAPHFVSPSFIVPSPFVYSDILIYPNTLEDLPLMRAHNVLCVRHTLGAGTGCAADDDDEETGLDCWKIGHKTNVNCLKAMTVIKMIYIALHSPIAQFFRHMVLIPLNDRWPVRSFAFFLIHNIAQ